MVRPLSIVTRVIVLLLIPCLVMLMTLTTFRPTAADSSFAADTFNRTVVDGWGSADVGGTYTLTGKAANFDVAGGSGTIRVPQRGATRAATLNDVSGQDVDILVRVQTDKVATGRGMDVDLVARRVTPGTEYRFRVHLGAGGTVAARIVRVLDGTSTQLGKGVVVDGLTHTADTPLRIRAQATDADPTVLRIKVWTDGQSEPAAWTYGYSDATTNLQVPGAVGLRSFVANNSTNVPVLFTFADYQVTAMPPMDDPILVGAGDIATCGSSADEATAALLDGIRGTIFTAGDNAYPDGSTTNYSNCYAPSWGRHKVRTRPAPGNHEYRTKGASAYFKYFGSRAGESGKGYYSYDLGDWHIIVLNSASNHGSSSPQYTWLAQDLADDTSFCTLAYWHHPRYSSGSHGSDPSMDAIWDLLFQHSVDVALSGHDHSYERFSPIDDADNHDDAQGIRSFVVGTGGAAHYAFTTIQPHSEVRDGETFGVLQLTLHPSSYDWEFVPVPGETFTDAGSANCH